MLLKHTLLRMKKTELDALRKLYGLKNISHLNMADLVDRLEVLVPALFPFMLERIGQTQYHLLCLLTDKSKHERPIEIDSDCVDVLEQYGLAFSADAGRNEYLVMPKEMAAIFRKADEEGLRLIVRRNTEWVDLAHGINAGSKLDKAQEMGISIISDDEFMKILNLSGKQVVSRKK